MKLIMMALFVVNLVSVSGVTFASASDDIKWIGQCMTDNKDEGQSVEVVRIYCECMNDKMSEEETLSISQWEKTHPKEEKECDAQAGWK